ncbi:MAG: hypothetical protein EHM35_16535 [Planctomycetaceae bacterium]|nr:MAG: hypothetical protein EHM35_16535 [Planctomycetaceae bacterium]
MTEEHVLAEAGVDFYRSTWRSIVRGMWSGALSYEQAFDAAMTNISRGLTQAWYEGAKEVGILPADLTPEERIALEQAKNSEMQYINGFLEHIEANSKANKGKLQPLFTRAEMWANRYNDVRNQAKLEANTDPKLEWQLNVVRGAVEHCSSCAKVAGKIKRASTWAHSPWKPQARGLECKGFLCACGLVPTDKPLTRGRLPSFP